MVIFDANMILRYLLDDNKEMADKAEEYLSAGDVLVTLEVMAEVVYVLRGVYSMDRDKIARILKGFMELVDCRDMEVIKKGLDAYGTYNLDFVDCVLLGYHVEKQAEIVTFDKKLSKLLRSID